MLRTIDRYILREAAPPFFLALLIFTFILEIPPLSEVAEKLIAKGVPAGDVARIMVTLLPQALGVTIPMALLLGLLIGFSRLSADRETVALQACGVSIYRILRPVAVFGVLAWAATSYVMVEALPDANQAFREITYRIVASRAEHEVRPRVFFEDFPNMVLYVDDVPAQGGGWNGVFLARTEQASPDIYVARHGRMLLDREGRRVDMILSDGVRHRVSEASPQDYEVFQFEEMTFSLDPESVFPRSGPQRGDPELTIPELQAEIVRLESEGLSPHNPIMAIHKKFSIPVACLVFALIALSLGVTSRKDGKLASFVLGTGVIFSYYVFMYIGEAMAKGHLVSPHLAMWLPNLFLGGSGVALLFWRARSSELRIHLPLPIAAWSRLVRRRPAAGPAGTTTPPSPSRSMVIPLPHLTLPRLTLLDSYIANLYLKLVGLAFIGLLGIFYVATFIDLSDKLFKGQATGGMLLEYFWFATPQFVYFVLPIAALVGTLVTIGLLTKTSELTVMKACGISLYRAAAPVLVFGVVWSGVLFGLEETILAHSNRRAEALRSEIRSGRPQMFDSLNRRWQIGKDGSIYHYVFFDRDRQELNGLSVYRVDPETWRVSRRTFVQQARFERGWRSSEGWTRRFENGDPDAYESFESRDLTLEAPEYFASERPDAERMTYGELKAHTEELAASGYNVVPYLVALQRKLSFPFVTVIMTLLGVPFAVTTGRSGALYGVGAGVVLAISYWILFSISAAIGSAGMLSPVLAAWAPNLVFMAGAAYLLLAVRT